MPHVRPVPPLPTAVDADDVGLDDRVGNTEVSRDRGQRLLPELVLLAVPAEDQGKFIDRVVRAQQHLRLQVRRAGCRAFGTEGDPAGEHVTLRAS